MARELAHQAGALGLPVRLVYEFVDRDVDAALEADGIEHSTLIALEHG